MSATRWWPCSASSSQLIERVGSLGRLAHFRSTASTTVRRITVSRIQKPRSPSLVAKATNDPQRTGDRKGPEVDPVGSAVKAAEAALEAAEKEAQSSDKLPSAVDENSAGFLLTKEEVKQKNMLRRAVKLAVAVGAVALVYIAHIGESWLLRASLAAAGGVTFALAGLRKNSLSISGAYGAAIVGALTLICSFRCTVVLLCFFFASSAITRIGEDLKDIDEDHKKGGQRDIVQVLCNGGVPTVLAVLLCLASGGADLPMATSKAAAMLSTAFMGYYACCCGDTWASELGTLSKQQPRLITTFRPVRRGTNGGVTLLGFAASLAGGVFIGLCFYVAGLLSPGKAAVAHRPELIAELPLVLLGGAAGLLGSIIDSILGATIQFTGYNLDTKKITSKRGDRVAQISGLAILDNNAVNLVSATTTAFITAQAAAFFV